MRWPVFGPEGMHPLYVVPASWRPLPPLGGGTGLWDESEAGPTVRTSAVVCETSPLSLMDPGGGAVKGQYQPPEVTWDPLAYLLRPVLSS